MVSYGCYEIMTNNYSKRICIIAITIVVTLFFINFYYNAVKYYQKKYTITTSQSSPDVIDTLVQPTNSTNSTTANCMKLKNNSKVQYLCEYNASINNSPNCLCFVDSVNTTSTTDYAVISPYDEDSKFNISTIRCAMTVNTIGRLGNVMGQYASLTGLAQINKRPAFMTEKQADILKKYFKVTMPTISDKLSSQIKWNDIGVHDWMEESYRTFDGQFIHLSGYPCSFTFYDHMRDKIKKEFTLHDNIKDKAQNTLRNLTKNRNSTTFVGVHVRRGDYIHLMAGQFKGVLAEKEFFVKATAYFRQRYPDAVFVVVSNGMDWCKQNIPNEKGDVFFIGNNNEADPISDFAILINCNHTIFTIGTYGYWAAYLVGGETIYLSNFTLPDSPFLQIFKPEATFLSNWIPVAADLSPRLLKRTLSLLHP
ncbi:fucosyltransferase 1 (galactoside 2-alpha-L-fucosyltransferase, H blood group) [Chamberlinius hualienensis]